MASKCIHVEILEYFVWSGTAETLVTSQRVGLYVIHQSIKPAAEMSNECVLMIYNKNSSYTIYTAHESQFLIRSKLSKIENESSIEGGISRVAKFADWSNR